MTSTTHNLPDEVLFAYSAGALPEAFDLVVACHVSLSDDSRSRLEAWDAVGGACLENAPRCEMSEGSFEATIAKIRQSKGPIRTSRSAPDSVLPAPLQAYVGGDLDAVRWRNVGMGVKQAILDTAPGASVRLLHIPKGMAMPDHSHGGTEMTLVLRGAYRDEADEFRRGDVEIADEEVQHTPVAFGDEDCVCLSATDARLKFSALLPRLAQPFLRI